MSEPAAQEATLVNFYRAMNADFQAITLAIAGQNAKASRLLGRPVSERTNNKKG